MSKTHTIWCYICSRCHSVKSHDILDKIQLLGFSGLTLYLHYVHLTGHGWIHVLFRCAMHLNRPCGVGCAWGLSWKHCAWDRFSATSVRARQQQWRWQVQWQRQYPKVRGSIFKYFFLTIFMGRFWFYKTSDLLKNCFGCMFNVLIFIDIPHEAWRKIREAKEQISQAWQRKWCHRCGIWGTWSVWSFLCGLQQCTGNSTHSFTLACSHHSIYTTHWGAW